jgi:formylglycine-generating enzyme required for sulfatase activity/serine/threonine protein kinase
MTDDVLGLVGSTIAEKYLVEEVVGEGGFAIVYRATHLLWRRPVALKVFKGLADLPATARDELTEDFIREGALLAELSEKSASICQARDIGVLTAPGAGRVPYMVLEWLDGQSLEAVLERESAAGLRPRSLLEAIRLLDPIADALALAHARGIAHRDVKPANIFLLGDARDGHCPVKLLDFGIAKVVQGIQRTSGAFDQTGKTLQSFTPGYAAPEQFSRTHGATGPWTDVFALALVMVELMTGKTPLAGDDLLQIAFTAADKRHRPTPRALGAETSDAVEEVFLHALAVETVDRLQSADRFWHDLRAAAEFGPQSVLLRDVGVQVATRDAAPPDVLGRTAPALRPDPPVVPAPPAARRSSLGLIAGGAALLAAGVVGGWVAMGREARAPAAAPPSASAQRPVAEPAPAASTTSPCPDGMALIPGGDFFMGSDDGPAAEKPAHKVHLAPYCMDVHEVTTAKYLACSNGGWCQRAALFGVEEGKRGADDPYDKLCNQRDPEGRADHPINCVTWEMADVYCRANKARLPTEAEWEFAARGSDGRVYPWGDAPPSAAHLNACGSECAAWAVAAGIAPIKPMYAADDHWPSTAPVGSFPQGRSKFGVDDLAGNVWEWVSDWYGTYGKGDGVKPELSPTGPATGTRRVIRGGGWNGNDPSWERPSFRYSKPPTDRNSVIGFRCALTPSEDRAGSPGGAGSDRAAPP